MSKKGLSFLAATYLLLTFAGGSNGQLQLSIDTSDAASTNVISLHCRDVYPQDNNSMAWTGDHHSGMEMQMMKQGGDRRGENESLQFKLNNSVIYPNSTFLHNYSIESVSMEMGHHYIAHFQLINAYEIFVGNFTCVRNCTVSNDVVLAYLPLRDLEIDLNTSFAASAIPPQTAESCGDLALAIGGTLSAAVVVIIAMLICLILACYKRQRVLGNRAKDVKSWESWDHSAMPKKSSQSSYWKDHSVVHFTANGYAVPRCSLAKLANERRLDKHHSFGTNSANVISKSTISKVLKYLLHPSDCSRPSCLCKEVKEEYNALVSELKSDLDCYAPHTSTILTSELVLEAQIQRETVQGRGQVQTALTQGDDQVQCSAITIEENRTLSYCKDGCSLKAPTSNESSIYYPQLSPVSGPELKLSYVDPVDRVTFDSRGGRYTNQDHHICLRVPPGAVPEGEQVTIEVGVSLCCPILFPAGKRPVSAMLSMCVVGNPNYQFLKPVEVSLSHCLDVATKETVNNLEIEFLKSGHNLFCFHKADGSSTFEPGTHSGTLITKHFCCFCIAANKSKTDLTKIYYRLIKVVPKSTPSLRWKARYCITYFLNTCLRTLEKQYHPQTYDVQSLQRFKFATNASSDKPYVGINFERRIVGGWNLGLESSSRVYASEVDFWDIEPSDLEQMEAEELYPPRFVIDVCGTQAHTTGQVWINFSGMENEFKSELILDANRGSHAPPFVQSREFVSEPALSTQLPDTTCAGPSDRDLMNKVAAVIPTKWKLVGLQLGLEHPQLEMIEQKQSYSVLRFCDVFTEWKKRRTSECSWSTLIDALNSQLVGEAALADKLKREMEISSIDSGINTM